MIRGGAIGDFILTLPALKALRDRYPRAYIELLGYKHIAGMAERRFYADSVRSIEQGGFATLFGRNTTPAGELADYFAGFDLIVSYLYDPDHVFSANLIQCGIRRLVEGPGKLDSSAHATRQLVRPVEQLGIKTQDLAPKIFVSDNDRQFANRFLADLPQPIIALHPGSGSERKNWPVQNWMDFGDEILGCSSVVIVSGEADQIQVKQLKRHWSNSRVRFADNVPLSQLAAVLQKTIFIGHDSGISHLAAAAGANCILLFGPTNPGIWAPLNKTVQVLRADTGRTADIAVSTVCQALASLMKGTRFATC